MESVATSLPLPTLLSHALVAYTIELDNEAEHRLPRRTTREDDPAARGKGPGSCRTSTEGGRRAQEVWRAVPADMEARWRARFGDAAVDRLERTLGAVFDVLPIDPPDYLPVVFPTQNGKAEEPPPRRPDAATARSSGAELSQLLSGVLLAFTVDVERTHGSPSPSAPTRWACSIPRVCASATWPG